MNLIYSVKYLQSSDHSLVHPLKYAPSRADSGTMSIRLPNLSATSDLKCTFITPLSVNSAQVHPLPADAWSKHFTSAAWINNNHPPTNSWIKTTSAPIRSNPVLQVACVDTNINNSIVTQLPVPDSNNLQNGTVNTLSIAPLHESDSKKGLNRLIFYFTFAFHSYLARKF